MLAHAGDDEQVSPAGSGGGRGGGSSVRRREGTRPHPPMMSLPPVLFGREETPEHMPCRAVARLGCL